MVVGNSVAENKLDEAGESISPFGTISIGSLIRTIEKSL
jgi:hypothetical protein